MPTHKPRSRRIISAVEPVERRLLMATVPSGFTETNIATNLTSPTALDIAPDGRVFFVDQSGHVRVIENNALVAQPFADLSSFTDGSGEKGMLGIALAPDFATSRQLYVYYTRNAPASHNVLSRLTADLTNPNVWTGTEEILFELPNVPTNTIWHMGGSIQFGPDNKIYIAVGDHQQGSSSAQSHNSAFGKILRVNTDGSIPTDNPFYNQNAGIYRSIWALGLRNPYSTAFQPGTSRFFLNDVGGGAWEEIDDGIAGANYGWATTEGDFNQATYPNFTRPWFAYDHSAGKNAITGGAFYNPASFAFPAQYHGDYFYVDFGTGQMWNIELATKANTVFATGLSNPTGVDVGNDGTLYYISRGAGAGGNPGIGTGNIFKIQYVANLPPSINQHPQNKLVSVGQSATFTVAASGTAPLAFQWTRNGLDILGATSTSYTLTNAQLIDHGAQFRARVTNAFGTQTSNPATLSVTTNQPPVGTINNPAAGTTYRAGDTINYNFSATDNEDGTLTASSMTWWADLHHDTHTHPFIAPSTGSSSGSFVIPTSGESSHNVWYRIHLLVTDSIGLQHQTFRDITPIVSTLTINSNIPGITFLLDGQPHTTPFAVQGVANLTRTIGASTIQNVGGQWYQFTGWSDGGDANHSFSFPDTNSTLTATFTPLSGVTYVSDLPFAATPTNGFGPVERDRSNGNTGATDGNTITLNGVTYAKGLGVHAGNSTSSPAEAVSRVTFHLDGAFTRFLTDVGVDDEVTSSSASVVFQVFSDGIKVYDSGIMGATSPTRSVDLDISGVRIMELVITDAGDGKNNDHGDWAGAMLIPVSGPAPAAAHYEFDDGSGTTARDLSTNANHGATSGTITWVPGYIAKNALSFDGSTAIVTVPSAPQLNPTGAVTVAGWINPTSWSGGDRRILQKGDTTYQYRLGAIGGNLNFAITGVGSVSAALPSTGVWHHVAGTYNGSALTLFVDGVAVASAAATGAIPTTTNALAIGGRNGGAATERFNGIIDDVRIYNRPLNPGEISNLAHPININFQLASAPTPAGYLADGGDLYANRGNGQTYGWNVNQTDNSRDRNLAGQPDQRLDTLNQFHAAANWEIALPNGQYLVYLSVGDPSNSNFTPTLNLEGFNVYTNITLAANQFAWISRIVTITDGKLTIDQGADGEKELRPNYIQIYSLNFDSVAPTATIAPVSPDPRSSALTSVQINFSEAVTGVHTADFTLTRDTTSLSLAGATLISSNGGVTWTLGNLTSMTSKVGAYTLTLNHIGSGIIDSAGNELAASASDNWVMNAISGTSGDDDIRLVKNGSVADYYYNGTWQYAFNPTGITQLIVTPGDGNDTLTLDLSAGGVAHNNIDFAAGSGTADTLRIIGTSSTTDLDVQSSQLLINGSTIALSGNETVLLDADPDSVIPLNALVATAPVALPSGKDLTLRFSTVSISGAGALDLADNDLIADNTPFTTLRDLVLAGFGAPAGITSSTATGTQILALFDNGLLGSSDFNGVTLSPTSVVGKYTFFGDVNLDGQVTGDDYTIIDSNLDTDPAVGIEWLSGDANLDGIVTGDDYTIVDSNLGSGAGNPLSPASLPLAVSQPNRAQPPDPLKLSDGSILE